MSDTPFLLDYLLKNDFRDLRGARLTADIPVSEDLLNRMFHERVRQTDSLERMDLRLPGNNTMAVEVKAKIPTGVLGIRLPVQRQLLLDIEPEMELHPTPLLRLRLREGLSGLDRTVMGWFRNLLSRSFPGELDLRQNLLIIDFGAMLHDMGFGMLTGFIRRAVVNGEAGRVLVRLEMEIG